MRCPLLRAYDATVALSAWASAMLCLPEEKETHMPFPFDVGNPVMQEQLDWVALPAQPPPPQGRDTHALWFRLRKNMSGVGMVTRYSGLMFFRPQGAGGGAVGSLPGLTGTGHLVANSSVCQEISGGSFPADHAKVNIMFRRRPSAPAQVFATIIFLTGLLPDTPSTTEPVEASNVSLSGPPHLAVIGINPQWELQLQMTTVLLRSP